MILLVVLDKAEKMLILYYWLIDREIIRSRGNGRPRTDIENIHRETCFMWEKRGRKKKKREEEAFMNYFLKLNKSAAPIYCQRAPVFPSVSQLPYACALRPRRDPAKPPPHIFSPPHHSMLTALESGPDDTIFTRASSQLTSAPPTDCYSSINSRPPSRSRRPSVQSHKNLSLSWSVPNHRHISLEA